MKQLVKCGYFLTLSACLLKAATIPVSGSASLSYLTDAFDFTGSGIAAHSESPDGTQPLFSCYQNGVCNILLNVPATTLYTFDGYALGLSDGTLNGVFANGLAGDLTLTGSVFLPLMTSNDLTVTAPVTVTGTLTGISCGPTMNLTYCDAGSQSRIETWTASINAAGTLTLHGAGEAYTTFGQDVFLSAHADFTGTASTGPGAPTPEPNTVFPMLLSLAGLLFKFRSRDRPAA